MPAGNPAASPPEKEPGPLEPEAVAANAATAGITHDDESNSTPLNDESKSETDEENQENHLQMLRKELQLAMVYARIGAKNSKQLAFLQTARQKLLDHPLCRGDDSGVKRSRQRAAGAFVFTRETAFATIPRRPG